MDEKQQIELSLDENDITVRYFSGTGAGGQHRNRKQCSVFLTHRCGFTVKVEGRSKESNLTEAKKQMLKKLQDAAYEKMHKSASIDRKNQIGDSFRGNKRRTYNEKANEVTDHVNGKTVTWKDALKGNLTMLHA